MQTMKAHHTKPTSSRTLRADPPYGLFEIRFDNSKRRGGKPVKHEEAYGSLYPDGKVHLHTRAIPVTDFTALRQMYEYLEQLGECQIAWMASALANQIDEEI